MISCYICSVICDSPALQGEGTTLRFRSPRHQNLARKLIPALLGRAHNSRVVCQRRDVDAHPSFTWQRPAPGRTARMAEGPGGLGCPVTVKRQQWRGAVARLQWLKVRSRGSCKGAEREAKVRSRSKIAERGCRKATLGDREVPGEPCQGSPRRPARVSLGPPQAAPGLPSRHPRPVATPGVAPRDGRRVRKTDFPRRGGKG